MDSPRRRRRNSSGVIRFKLATAHYKFGINHLVRAILMFTEELQSGGEKCVDAVISKSAKCLQNPKSLLQCHCWVVLKGLVRMRGGPCGRTELSE